MRVSPRADLGVRLVAAIAALGRPEGSPVSRRSLLDSVDIPDASLVAILGDLRRRQIVRSRRGVNGGWALARDAESISVGDVVRALEGPLGARRSPHDGADTVALLWRDLDDAVRAVLDRTTIADLVRARGELPPADSGRAAPAPDVAESGGAASRWLMTRLADVPVA